MQHFKKRIAALALALAMLLSLAPMALALDAGDFPDMPAEDDPSYAAVKAAVDNGLLTGENGKLNLEGTILRSTISKIVASAFGAADEADLSGYTDIAAGKWYVEWLARAGQMGIMHGSGGKMRPDAPMTRQEAYVVLSRALKLGKGAAGDLEGVEGAAGLAAWAVPETAPLVKAGYVSDLSGAGGPITRGEFVQLMHKIFSDYISEAGAVTEVGGGSVIINAPDVTLKDCTVKGDLVIADGVGDGDVTLDNVRVEGRLVVRGGGVNSIRILNKSAVMSDVVITKVNGNVRVFADSTVGMFVITVEDGKDDVIIEGTVGIVTVASSETPVVLRNAAAVGVEVTVPNANVTLESSNVNTVTVSASDAKVELTGSTTVSTMEVDSAAEGVTVTTGTATKINTVKADADVTVDGGGKVGSIQGEGSVTDSQGKEVETAPAPSGSEPSGTGSSNSGSNLPAPHTHTWATAWSFDNNSHWHACTVSGCTARGDESGHQYVDGVCGCGKPMMVDTEEHHWGAYQYTYASVKDGHYQECTDPGCYAVLQDDHSMGKPDANGDMSCGKCGFVIKAGCVGGHTVASWTVQGSSTSHEGTCSVCGGTVVSAHIWGAEAADGKVTCTAPGCGATQNVSGTPHQHTHGPWTRIENSMTHQRHCTALQESACNGDGAAWQIECCVDNGGVCKDCGGAMDPDTCAHVWNKVFYVDEDIDATCTEPGRTHRKCNKCGTVEGNVVVPAIDPVNGHSWVNDGVDVATCTQGGSQPQICENCPAKRTIPVEAKGHTWSEWYEDFDENGDPCYSHQCEYCLATETRETPGQD